MLSDMFHTLDFSQCSDSVQRVRVCYEVEQDPQREISWQLFYLFPVEILSWLYRYDSGLDVREYPLRETGLFA